MDGSMGPSVGLPMTSVQLMTVEHLRYPAGQDCTIEQ